jgi:hypothetical protein
MRLRILTAPGSAYAVPCGRRAAGARGTCVAALGGVRNALLASTVIALAGCNIGSLGDGQTYSDKSPGTVMLKLDLPSTQSFCDQAEACSFTETHISISTLAGQALEISGGFCNTLCSNGCRPQACPAIACPAPSGQVVTQVGMNWDGSYFEPGTCGNGNSCITPRYVLPGRYKAHMCATPGTVATSDVGPPTCTASGPAECVDVTFDLPGPPLVEVPLPDPTLPQ